MRNKKILIIIIASLFLAALLAGGFFGYRKYISQKNQKIADDRRDEAMPRPYYEISDEAAGVFFKIGKNFQRMPAEKLRLENPSFVYGFSAADDGGVKCFISQTARSEGGNIILSKLRDGIFEKLKEGNPDATLDDAKIVEVGGGESNKGAKLKMSYTKDENGPASPSASDRPSRDGSLGGKKIGYVQWETAGITEKFATFAFCSAPKSVIELYSEDFDLFLDSIKIK